MFHNVDAPAMRRINKATVLQFIRDHRTTSRIDIAQVTGLNKATVSYIVDELITEQWVQEIGYGSSSGGRKPILLRFNASGAYAIGMDVQVNSIKTMVCNTRNEPVYRSQRSLSGEQRGALQEHLMTAIVEETRAAVAATPSSPHGLVGIGLALPGLVDVQTGSVHYLPGLPVRDWPIRDQLAQAVGIPVFCENDANCGAWGELTRSASHSDHLAFVNAGTGIGVGLIIAGQLYRGRQGLAGEFGHTTIMPLGQACPCGNYGCWEEYASERSLRRYIIEAGGDPSVLNEEQGFVDQMLSEAQADNRAYIRAFNTLGQYLGIGIANITNALNPDRISLGGTLSQAATFILPEIERIMNYRTLTQNRNIPVSIASANSVAIGAAALVIAQTLFDTRPTIP
ncbi:MAG: ROK family transcriptional regulator [Firmicutes bacterium]|nr:ROK family transcriptional regulator [Bacillota bacterium]